MCILNKYIQYTYINIVHPPLIKRYLHYIFVRGELFFQLAANVLIIYYN